MASFTENLGLKKPDRSDRFSIEDFNGNMDIIDTIPIWRADRALWVCQWEKRTEI
ncbi:hypothetical protein predicted by Glimmer/Critica [Ruminococcus bicirculans (ex Wegman et al. 2014)]|uniref:Uncharacterized protein n=1 Tax=Ruminococcus bicirculans (ex Wegman et al. 2014) TaxID=1160721 RepID=A0ABM9QJS2_9FIRM|nr:hypothetical protein [Ruminococcus bicirculans (ex Wegman et al. 2014)]CCO06278.1 hypothetical protein predicted by Glimmer/Critica [Ruminococcus bicirculans (ex Wegman et al. 2014)]